jgi:hypothetical protein
MNLKIVNKRLKALTLPGSVSKRFMNDGGNLFPPQMRHLGSDTTSRRIHNSPAYEVFPMTYSSVRALLCC